MGKLRTPRPKKLPPGVPPPPPDDPNSPDRPLDENEQRFVEEYLIDRNASRAYRTVYPGSTHHTARRHGYQIRNRPNVAREIEAAIRAQSVRTRVTADLALKEIARVAFSDIYDLFDPETHQLRQPRHIPYETRKAISSIKVARVRTTTTTRSRGRTQTTTSISDSIVTYTLWPKMEALGRLCRHLGLDTEITPLEALLQALPRELSMAVRTALANPNSGPAQPPSTNGHTRAT